MKTNKYTIKNALMVAAPAALSAFASTTAYADGIDGALKGVADEILTQARAIILPILAVMIVFYGVKIVISPDPKTVAEAKKGAIICFIGAVIVYAAPIIYSTIANAVQGTGNNKFYTDTSAITDLIENSII